MADHDDPCAGAALDALLDLDAPTPSEGFDAAFAARFALERALDADQPAPGAGFDDSFAARLTLERLLDADEPTPREGFDAVVAERLARERGAVVHADDHGPSTRGRSGGGRLLTFPRRGWVAVAALAAAAALSIVALRPSAPPAPPPAELGLLAHLDLLADYDTLTLLDAVEDEETFLLVAQLDALDDEEGRP